VMSENKLEKGSVENLALSEVWVITQI
jgi:hypothetical protein